MTREGHHLREREKDDLGFLGLFRRGVRTHRQRLRGPKLRRTQSAKGETNQKSPHKAGRFDWRPLGESNPCCQDENLES